MARVFSAFRSSLEWYLDRIFPCGWSHVDKRALGVIAKAILTGIAFVAVAGLLGTDFDSITPAIFVVLGIRIFASFVFFGEYKLSWTRASSRSAMIEVALGAVCLAIYGPVLLLTKMVSVPFLLLEWLVFQYLYNAAIFGYRHLYRYGIRPSRTVVIYGSSHRGARLAQQLHQSGSEVICFIDDSSHEHKMVIDGIPIYSLKQTIVKIRRTQSLDTLVFALDDASPERIDRRWKRLRSHFKDCKILPAAADTLRDRSFVNQLKDVTVEDLLARKPKDLDKAKISEFLKGRSVLITGAGGSIGSELARQCEAFGVRELLLLDHSEFNLYQIAEELPNAVPLMVSVTDKASLERVFEEYRPEIVIHAAAYKHVPLVEQNPMTGIRNNVAGTRNTIDLAIRYKAKKFVLISTDKAVRPTNVMGATKRVCELYAQNSNGQGTDIVAVRFGNVLGSSGSVIPKFKKLIEEGRDLPVTHPDITRYFMLIPEACSLVLQAGAIGHGGEVFILDMGEPVRIADLAHRMLKLSGRQDLNVVFTGLRPGEKLYEELLISDADLKTEYRSIMVTRPTKMPIDSLRKSIDRLLASDDPLEDLNRIVPEFDHRRDNRAAAA
ncbi:MAG TPA: nucleoside-diphosphate sugar epimerase/dehydratase [Fibrobacteria bacterium]|nr:nucleoside-diphosphate sugar epimerase/dehydratase [Fibrobacteria bacterium]